MTFVRHGFDESSVSGSNMSKGSSWWQMSEYQKTPRRRERGGNGSVLMFYICFQSMCCYNLQEREPNAWIWFHRLYLWCSWNWFRILVSCNCRIRRTWWKETEEILNLALEKMDNYIPHLFYHHYNVLFINISLRDYNEPRFPRFSLRPQTGTDNHLSDLALVGLVRQTRSYERLLFHVTSKQLRISFTKPAMSWEFLTQSRLTDWHTHTRLLSFLTFLTHTFNLLSAPSLQDRRLQMHENEWERQKKLICLGKAA